MGVSQMMGKILVGVYESVIFLSYFCLLYLMVLGMAWVLYLTEGVVGESGRLQLTIIGCGSLIALVHLFLNKLNIIRK